MNSENKYYAFISYNSADEKWAKWLQHNLEYYHIPSALCKEYPELPKKIRPVFWYKQDLSGTKLKESLKKELNSSKYLIVISSPNSAKSDWVNDEVITFIEQGKSDKIIPFIVGGIPHANNSEEECFPPALCNLSKDEEIRGIDIRRKEGKYHALVDVIATMFGIRFDELWKRHERRRKNIRNIWIAIICILMLFALGIFDYKRPKYEYYANYVDIYGKPVGIKELTESQRTHRNNSYQFEYRRIPFGEPNSYSWRVVKVKAVNSSMIPQEIVNTEYSMRYPIQEYKYYEKSGNVSQILYCNEKGNPIIKYNITSRGNNIATIADIVSVDEEKGSGFIGADQLSILYGRIDQAKSKAKIVRIVYERDSCGYIIKQTFHSNNDNNLSLSAIADENGTYGIYLKLDNNGLPITIDCLDRNGNKIISKKGYSTVIYKYDNWLNSIYTKYCDFNSEPIINELNWAICTNVSDEYGNIIEEHYYEREGVRCKSNRGVASIRYEYDSKGFLTNEKFYGTEGNPILNYRGIARYGYKNDDTGNVLESTFYDVANNIKQTVYGFAKAKNKYDSKGNLIEVAYFDEKENPCFSIEGCAKWTRKYDEKDNLVEHWFFGKNNKLCLLDGYIAGWTADYNEDKLCIEKRYYNIEKQLTLSEKGYAIVRNSYDDYGNQDGACYYNDKYELCRSKDGFAQWKALYNVNGQKEKESYYDEFGFLCNNKDGYASIEVIYDSVGNINSIVKYDVNKNVVD